jgi:hypothetical protein
MTGRFKSSKKRKRNVKQVQGAQGANGSVDGLDELQSPDRFVSQKKVRWDGDGDQELEENWSEQEDDCQRPDKVKWFMC